MSKEEERRYKGVSDGGGPESENARNLTDWIVCHGEWLLAVRTNSTAKW